MVQFPSADRICIGPGPGTVFAPTWIVAINLPGRAPITGFLFAAGVLSEPLQAELDASLGLSPNGVYTRCPQAAARQQFDARVKALVDGLSAGTLDSATQANLAQLMHLAQSIRFD